MAGFAQAIVFLLGIASVGHFVVVQLSYQEWFWLIVGLMCFPVVAVLWPIAAWFFGLLPGATMIVFYVMAALAVGLTASAQQQGSPYH